MFMLTQRRYGATKTSEKEQKDPKGKFKDQSCAWTTA
jgi:hypothetical protein